MRPAELLGLVVVASIWGSNFLLVDVALDGLAPAQIVMCRLVLGGATLLLVARLRSASPRLTWRLWARVAALGLLAQAGPWLLFAWGQQSVSTALAGIYTGTTPLLTIPVVWLLLRRRPSRGEAYAAVIGFAGIAVVLSPWEVGPPSSVLGQALCLAGAVCYAAAFAYTGRLLASVETDRAALAAAQSLAAAVLLVPVGGGSLVRPAHTTATVILAVSLLGVGSGVAFLLNYWLVARIGPVQASLAFYLIPVVAVVIGVVFNAERLSLPQAAGTALVIAALATLYTWNRRQARGAAQSAPTGPRPVPETGRAR